MAELKDLRAGLERLADKVDEVLGSSSGSPLSLESIVGSTGVSAAVLPALLVSLSEIHARVLEVALPVAVGDGPHAAAARSAIETSAGMFGDATMHASFAGSNLGMGWTLPAREPYQDDAVDASSPMADVAACLAVCGRVAARIGCDNHVMYREGLPPPDRHVADPAVGWTRDGWFHWSTAAGDTCPLSLAGESAVRDGEQRDPATATRDLDFGGVKVFDTRCAKPAGLWLGHGEREWPDWYAVMNGRKAAGARPLRRYSARFREDARVLVLGTRDAVLAFARGGVDWVAVADEYDAVAFVDYARVRRDLDDEIQAELEAYHDAGRPAGAAFRFDPATGRLRNAGLGWFMALDCSSACVFRPREALEAFEVSPER